jgi:ADP-ribosylglycohydrolase
MRSVILGAALPDDMPRLRELVRLSTRVTHRNVKAELGSWIVALAAAHSVRSPDISPASFRAILAEFVDWQGQEQFEQLMEQALQSAEARQSTTEFAKSIGRSRGVSGYIVYTTPVVIQAWLRYGDDFPTAVQETIRCGGDADTTAAIVGGLVAARLGVESIPQSWQDGICEWPRTVTWMDRLGQQVQDVIESGAPQRPAKLPWWGLVPRNLLFLFVVFAHVIRRAFPPY